MKALLKILAVFGLTTPLAVNVVACGGDKSNSDTDEVTENTNVGELLEKAKDQVNLGLGHLIEEYKNLTFEDQFTNLGPEISSYLNSLPSDIDSDIKNNETIKIKDIFLHRLQKDINSFLVDKYLMQVTALKPLFGNIPINELLTIDISQTTLNKILFKWQGVDFGVAGYDPSNPEYNITMWYKIKAQLKLKLAYKNESNINLTYEFDSNFNYNYANAGANLRKLIDASTAKVEEKLKNFTIEVPANTSDSGLNTEVKNKILSKIANSKVNLDMIEMVPTATLKKYDKYDSGDHMFQAITKPTIEESITSLKTYLAPSVIEFTNKLNNWIGSGSDAKKITEDRTKINNFGTCTISNWTVSGLTLKPMSLDFVTSRNETQKEWADRVATALGTIFCTKGLFAQGRIDLTTDNNLTIYMNPSDFDNFVSKDEKMSDISDYLNQKVNDKAKRENIIDRNISLNLNGLWLPKKNPNLSDSSVVKKVDDKTFIIKRGEGGMHGYNYLSISYDNVHFLSGCVNNYKGHRILFNNWIIKKADSDIWN